ncbi:MAG: virulence protein RhuM/Fic/DOC family protein [candidate division SR1 bacterium]|nr:virulence protein RhuM/Fic/DOC family protein [candidate division SR1 bacterium]
MKYFLVNKKVMDEKNKTGSIILYKAPDGTSAIDVKFEGETVWLNAHQMSEIFDVNRPAIVKHIQNIYKTGELKEKSTCSKMEHIASDGKKRIMHFYNLDTIISVGYRVNSKNATNFRIWATSVVKEYLIKGYVINQKRLSETGLKIFEKAIALVKKNIESNVLTDKETKGMLSLVTNYAYSWIVLQKYDEGTLSIENLNIIKTSKLKYEEAISAINEMKNELLPKGEVSKMFGVEKHDGLRGVLEQINQTFDKKELYQSIEEKAAALLYFTIKNHPFTDGNKKIGAFLFVFFLAKNTYLYRSNGEKRIDDNTLVALTLLIATSENSEKDMLLKLVANFLIDEKPHK